MKGQDQLVIFNCADCHKDSPHYKERDIDKLLWVMVCGNCGFRTERPSAYKLMGLPYNTMGFDTLKAKVADEALKHQLFRTQLRNLHLAYIHAITQSGFTLTFYENGSVKSVAPKGSAVGRE